MKFSRRSFLQVSSAVGTWFVAPFRKIVKAKPIAAPNSSPPGCCYVYNPGMDIDGIGHLVFGQTHLIKGGVITKITDRIHAISEYHLDQGIVYLFPKRTILTNYFGQVTDRLATRIAPAKEITDGLIFESHRSKQPLIWIKEWDNSEVDIERINGIIYAQNINNRITKVKNLPIAAWRVSSLLKKQLLPALLDFKKIAEERLHEILFKYKHHEIRDLDTYSIRLCALLGVEMTITDKTMTAERVPDEDVELLSIRLTDNVTAPHFQPKERSREEAKAAIRERARCLGDIWDIKES